jgi:hypothetical protein
MKAKFFIHRQCTLQRGHNWSSNKNKRTHAKAYVALNSLLIAFLTLFIHYCSKRFSLRKANQRFRETLHLREGKGEGLIRKGLLWERPRAGKENPFIASLLLLCDFLVLSFIIRESDQRGSQLNSLINAVIIIYMVKFGSPA